VVRCKILDKIPISEIALVWSKKPASPVVEEFKKFVLANARVNQRLANSSEKPRV